MGLFKSKDKTRTELPNATTTPQSSNYNRDHDSTYYSSSNVSNADTNPRNNQPAPQPRGRAPGTTVVTTTTTTTTTTTVGADGETHTTSQPYNPSTDPPQQSETTVNQNAIPPVADTPQATVQSQAPQQNISQQQSRPNLGRKQSPARKPTPMQSQVASTPQDYQLQPPPPIIDSDPILRTNSTSGGRPIPPRSELRNSISSSPTTSNTSPPYPERSEARTSPNVQPLSTSPNRSNKNAYAPTSETADLTHNTTYAPSAEGGSRTHKPTYAPMVEPAITHARQPAQTTEPSSPIRPKTPNFSRPSGGTGTGATGATGAGPVTGTGMGTSKRGTLTSTIKGIHGAGEAIRGTINSGIARSLNDKEEEEKMRAVKEQGASEFRGSGLREGFREKADSRMRLRRKSVEQRGVYGSEGPQGLDAVEERSIGP